MWRTVAEPRFPPPRKCYSRLVSRAQRADPHDNAGWDFDIGEDKEFDFDEEIRLSSGIGRRKTVRHIKSMIVAFRVVLD